MWRSFACWPAKCLKLLRHVSKPCQTCDRMTFLSGCNMWAVGDEHVDSEFGHIVPLDHLVLVSFLEILCCDLNQDLHSIGRINRVDFLDCKVCNPQMKNKKEPFDSSLGLESSQWWNGKRFQKTSSSWLPSTRRRYMLDWFDTWCEEPTSWNDWISRREVGPLYTAVMFVCWKSFLSIWWSHNYYKGTHGISILIRILTWSQLLLKGQNTT